MNILYIDDCQDALDFMKDLLETEGFNVITCSESHESLKILDTQTIHCIITDLKMPILEGDQLISVIRTRYTDIPIIVVSAHITSPEKLLALGANEVLSKPIDNDALIEALYTCIAESLNKVLFMFDTFNLKFIKDMVYRRLIVTALKKTKGNNVKASELLGISRQSLIRYIKHYNIA